MSRYRFAFVSLVSVIALLAFGCQKPEEAQEPAAPAANRVENAQLGVAVADLSAFFKVKSQDGAEIVLVPADPQVEGTLTISASEPTTAGVNLVAAIEAHKVDLESREDGAYKGQRELGSPLGPAYYSRGQWTEAGRTMEETKIFTVHPQRDRQLLLTYVYPAGEDSGARLTEQLFAVLGELEPMALAAPADAPDASDAAPTDADAVDVPEGSAAEPANPSDAG